MGKKYLILVILLLAAGLRLYGLSLGDPLTDEVLYAFRAVGPLDFDVAEEQATPFEWFDSDIPSWAKLSFHDHPPLIFRTQYIFMKIFGETNFAFRLPSALLGIVSVWLLYLIARRLFSENAALWASLVLAVTVNHVYISRIGLQESYVIFFLLLSSWLFLKALANDKYFIWLGAALGFSFLTKYTTFILVPIFLTYLLFRKWEYFLNKKMWLAAILAFLIFSPVIVYNLSLYRAVGHLDFQLSYIFGSPPEVWKVQPGKEIGTFVERAKNFLPNLFKTNSWLFLTAALAGLLFLRNLFVWLTLIYLVLLIFLIGPSFRFLTMLTPFLALVIGSLLGDLTSKRRLSLLLLFPIIIFEIFYSVNSQILYYPRGPVIWAWSNVREENYNWGYNELGEFLTSELEGKMPALFFEPRYQFIAKVQEASLQRALVEKLRPYPAIIIYDNRVQAMTQLWILDRLQVYHAWPVIKLEQYFEFLKKEGFYYFEHSGFKNYYFIMPTDKVPWKHEEAPGRTGEFFEEALLRRGLSPISIKNKRGQEAFRVYKFGPAI